ncbi:MAG: tRNA (adenosine(37)-N6)-threonylcarbamoyltransferase complex ATPase subunit type 1 TsaE [Bacteroidetes bacterium]|nr:tRNA (adenosine(37)-N6)-threonylcarbamoyltransferase complex ATPase subunit type 1 TsaE [Bacteroidota bacterium]
MEKLNLVLNDLSKLPKVAEQLISFAKGSKVFALHGEMGVGKTTLVKELCRQLGSDDHFSSPTFSLVNKYEIKPAKSETENQNADQAIHDSHFIYHIDLYRIKSLEEALAAGIDEYITGEEYCFIEWPKLIIQLLPHDAVQVHIISDGEERKITIFKS